MTWLLTRGGWLQTVVAFKAYKTYVNSSKRHVVTRTQMFFELITPMRRVKVPYERTMFII